MSLTAAVEQERLQKNVQHAPGRDSLRALAKLTHLVDGDFYVRHLWDEKGSATVEVMEPSTHARSGDAVAIAAYLGTNGSFDRAPRSRSLTPTRTSVTTARSRKPSSRAE